MSGHGTKTLDASYRESFNSLELVSDYVSRYEKPSYDTLLWAIEQQQLEDLLSTAGYHSLDGQNVLDFATGFGRILTYFSDRCGKLTGIDVSAAMLKLAAHNNPSARLELRDITLEDGPIEGGPFDIVTAFRFLLNAEPSLRESALKALAKQIRTPNGVLIINNHGSLPSVWSLSLLYKIPLKRRRGTAVSTGISARKLEKEFLKAGFVIVRSVGCGVLGGRFCSLLPWNLALRIEKRLARVPFLKRVALNRMYLLRLANPTSDGS